MMYIYGHKRPTAQQKLPRESPTHALLYKWKLILKHKHSPVSTLECY